MEKSNGESIAEPGRPPSEPPAAGPSGGIRAPLVLLSTLAVVAMLRWAQGILIPLALGILVSYALSPIVALMSRFRVPRWASAAMLLIVLVTALGIISYRLGAEGASAVAGLPESLDRVSKSLSEGAKDWGGLLKSFKEATNKLNEAVSEATGSKEPKDEAAGKPPAKIGQSTFDIHHFLWMGSTSALEWSAQIVLNLFLIYFLLASGDLFKRKLVKIAGDTFAVKRITVEILDEINHHIQRYLLLQLFVSVIVWLLSWVAFGIIGLESAMFWAIMAGVLHTVPYLGPALITAVTGLVGFFQFGSIEMGLLVAGSSAGVATITGMLLLPWLTGRVMRMNAGAVFITLLFWSWVWGVWGMLLGTPITMAIKTVCDQIENLKPVGELLGE